MDCSNNEIVYDLGGNIIKIQNSYFKVERNYDWNKKNRDSKKEIKKKPLLIKPQHLSAE